MEGTLAALQPIGSLMGGFSIVLWMAWRIFWKVDRRSQMAIASLDKTLALKDAKIDSLEEEVEEERAKRFALDEELSRVRARESSLETQIRELAEQVQRQSNDIIVLRAEIRSLREGNN